MRPQAPEGAPKQPGALKLLSGDANPELARKIADALHEPLDEMRITRFADGEIDVKIAHSVRGADVFLIQPTCEPVSKITCSSSSSLMPFGVPRPAASRP